MKLGKILSEARARARPGTQRGVTHYHAEFSGDGTNLDWSKWDAQKARNYEDAIANAKDEFQVDGQEYTRGVWVGTHINDVEFNDDATEEGPWRRAEVSGEACIVVQGKMEPSHPLFRKVQKDVSAMVSDHIEDATYNDRETQEERRNPYGFRGLNKRDFY